MMGEKPVTMVMTTKCSQNLKNIGDMFDSSQKVFFIFIASNLIGKLILCCFTFPHLYQCSALNACIALVSYKHGICDSMKAGEELL